MAKLIEILKSKGKFGAVGIMLIGLGHMVLVFLGKMSGTYQDGAVIFFTGLSLLGIRGKMDTPAK